MDDSEEFEIFTWTVFLKLYYFSVFVLISCICIFFHIVLHNSLTSTMLITWHLIPAMLSLDSWLSHYRNLLINILIYHCYSCTPITPVPCSCSFLYIDNYKIIGNKKDNLYRVRENWRTSNFDCVYDGIKMLCN